MTWIEIESDASWANAPGNGNANRTARMLMNRFFVFMMYRVFSLWERTLNVRGFPVREEGQRAWLESPNGLAAARCSDPRPDGVNTHFCVLVGLLPRARARGGGTGFPWFRVYRPEKAIFDKTIAGANRWPVKLGARRLLS